MSGGGGINRLGQGIEAMQGEVADPPARERRSPWRFAWWLVFLITGWSLRAAAVRPVVFSLEARPAFSAYMEALSGTRSSTRGSRVLDDRRLHHDLRQSRSDPADGLLGAPPGAAGALPVEFITLLPFVIPPIVLVFGLIRPTAGRPFRSRIRASGARVPGHRLVVLSFPYMYRCRHGPAGHRRPEPDRGGPEPGRRLDPHPRPGRLAQSSGGAAQRRVPHAGHRDRRVHRRAFPRPAGLRRYLSRLGNPEAYQPSAVALISFGLTWMAMGGIAVVGRGGRGVQIAGAH